MLHLILQHLFVLVSVFVFVLVFVFILVFICFYLFLFVLICFYLFLFVIISYYFFLFFFNFFYIFPFFFIFFHFFSFFFICSICFYLFSNVYAFYSILLINLFFNIFLQASIYSSWLFTNWNESPSRVVSRYQNEGRKLDSNCYPIDFNSTFFIFFIVFL